MCLACDLIDIHVLRMACLFTLHACSCSLVLLDEAGAGMDRATAATISSVLDKHLAGRAVLQVMKSAVSAGV